MGRLTRQTSAHSAAPSIWKGAGISPKNMPAATPPATEWRFMCHRRGCRSVLRKGYSQRLLSMAAWSGVNFLSQWRMGTL